MRRKVHLRAVKQKAVRVPMQVVQKPAHHAFGSGHGCGVNAVQRSFKRRVLVGAAWVFVFGRRRGLGARAAAVVAALARAVAVAVAWAVALAGAGARCVVVFWLGSVVHGCVLLVKRPPC